MKTRAFLLASLLLPLIAFSQNVNIGDILCTDGSTVSREAFPTSGKTADGIVFFVDDNNSEGWAVSLECQATNTNWVTSGYYGEMYDIPLLENFEYSREAMYDFDGYNNTDIIRSTHGADWYPAAWCVDFDHGWYLPAAGQMRWLIAYMNEINVSLAVVNGTMFVFDQPRWYWTSTERTGAHAVVLSQTGAVGNYPKWNYIGEYEIGVRAVKTFTIQAQSHHIGEIVTTPNGQQGVVFYTSPEDDSYWLVAMNDLTSTYKWGPETDITDLINYNPNDQFVALHGVHCGYDATSSMLEATGASSPYASSNVDLANGWHIPSVGQLSKLYAALPFIESVLANNGGTTLSDHYYWSSTESSNDKAWAINFGENLYTEGFLKDQSKSSSLPVRPVWSEPCYVEPPLPEPSLPDNILENDCNNNTPIPFQDGQLMYQTLDNINVYSTPLCGDIGGDGIVDIVVAHYTATDNYYRRHWSSQLDIYSGNDLSLQSTISIPAEVYLQYLPYGIARYPREDGNIQGAVFAICCDGKIRSYSKNGVLLNTSDFNVPCDGTPSFADFNRDGFLEVYIGNAIFDAATLKRLCIGPTNGNMGLSHRGTPPSEVYPHRTNYAIPYAYNVLENEDLELICGNTIYNVNIISRTDPSLNSVTVSKTINPPNGYPQDGQVAIADFDLDGEVEILVTKDLTDDCTEDYAYIYAYRPSNGSILFQYSLLCRSVGYPAICNIDNNPNPEILFIDYQYDTYAEKMYCLRYTPTSGLSTIWEAHHNDPSGMTTMAFFDFNLDEIPEIVYRDAYNLNIINGQDGEVLYSYPMYSGTAGEHPIIADVNNDGHAEIIVPGLLEYYSGVNGHGNLLMFGNSAWPNARKVWNQYAYNVTNVNDDLTVPEVCFDNATVFTASDGTIRRPYNNFLQQTYYITPEGEPYNPNGYLEFNVSGADCSAYTFNGITYTESGLYEQFIESPDGCDTLYHIDVSIGGTITHEWSQQACNHYVWNGTNYTEPGNYVQEFVTDAGCDSIVTLHLSFSDALEYDADTTACQSLWWNEQEYTEPGVYTQQFIDIDGCDSIVHLHLTFTGQPEAIPEIIGMTEVNVGTDLIVGQYYYHIDSVPLATHYEWSLEGADWIMDTTDTQCALLITTGGTAILKVRAWNDCGETEQEIVIHAVFFDTDEHQAVPVALYPNPAKDKVIIEAEGIQSIKVYDMLGQCLKALDGATTNKVEISLQDLASTVYTVEVLTQHGKVIKKLSVVK